LGGPERIEWRRRFPSRAVRSLFWYCVLAIAVVGIVWVLFGTEPGQLTSGMPNPLAPLPAIVTGLAALGAVPPLVCVLRRPLVAANHYALSVRPGALRTHVLPWALVDRVAVANTPHGRYLLVRYRDVLANLDRRPGWWDRRPLRRLARSGDRGRQASAGYDLAVSMAEFVGGPGSLMAAVAAFAPDHVVLAGELDPS